MIATPLPPQDNLRVSGPDATRFLQGQLSCDMQALGEENVLRGALCNLKGRVVADFIVMLHDGDCLLRTGPGMGAKLLEILGKYAVFSDVKLSLEPDLVSAIGVAGADAEQWLGQHFDALPERPLDRTRAGDAYLLRLNGQTPRYQILRFGGATLGDELELNEKDLAAWDYLGVQAGITHIDVESSERYTPQLLNYDISGVINFQKGCYTGQEVVARMYYRGKPKQRLFLVESDSPIGEDSELLQGEEGEEKAADILRIANAPAESEPHLALAVLSIEALSEGKSLRLSDQPEASLKALEVGYEKAQAR